MVSRSHIATRKTKGFSKRAKTTDYVSTCIPTHDVQLPSNKSATHTVPVLIFASYDDTLGPTFPCMICGYRATNTCTHTFCGLTRGITLVFVADLRSSTKDFRTICGHWFCLPKAPQARLLPTCSSSQFIFPNREDRTVWRQS
ncbi:hypothetical protein BaRGS_00020703 [Batillaria attramentaria]|uniref:Uncharacterized protein n=1 Tax=Batillaria attramentaria TaxID=370345 RepID=A0ABD0KMI5_9CAEN